METVADLLGRAEELLVRGDYGAVVALLEPLQEAGNPEVLYTLGLACYRLEKYQDAIDRLNESLALKPDYVLALARRGLAYRDLGQNPEATADFEQAITIEPQDHHDWRGRGIAFGELKQYEDALAAYDKALEIKPDYHQAWYSRGVDLSNLARYEEAIAAYDRAIEIKSDFHDAWHGRGSTLGNLGKYKEAIASYDKALEIKPDYHLVWGNRGITLGNLGRYEEEIASYDKALAIKPDNDAAWYNRGVALRNLGRNEEAIASYDKALAIKPDNDAAWNNRGNALLNLGRNEEAIAAYDKALEIKPDYHQAWYNRGITLGNLGRYEDALASYNKALDIKPDFHDAWNGRGVSLERLGRYEEAIASFDKALELKPDYVYTLLNRGAIFCDRLRLYKEALADFNKCLEIEPDNHGAWHNWGVVNSKQPVSFQDWLRLQQISKAGLERITFEEDPVRHLTIWKYYLWVCSRTRTPHQFKALGEDASEHFQRYLAQAQLQEWQEQRFRKEFASFQQIQVSTLVQSDDLEKALALAESQRNFRLGWLLEGQGYQQPHPPTYQEAQQLLDPDTAIIYWHYSPVGLTTFILKHGQDLQILPPPPAPSQGNILSIQGDIALLHQIQELEAWLKDWQTDYTDYGKDSLHDGSPNPKHPWRLKMKSRLDSPHKSARSLWSILNIKQLIEEYLKDVKNLILIPHRDLHLLPLHFLFPFDFTTTYLPSLQVGLNLQTIARIPSTLPLLNLHQPTGSLYIEITKDIINSLNTDNANNGENTKPEIHSLPSLNKSQFLQLLSNRHSTLQFMGHGSHNPEEPEKSYLSLPDGELLLTDILHHPQLDLSSYRLICLAACESGITSTQNILDEYIGWGSAFLAKQARAVISTLWNVDLQSSAFLTIKFYQLFSNPKAPKSAPQALREAQEWITKLEYSDLVEWYEELADLAPNPQHRDYLHTEADKLRADSEKINSMERPFSNPYHWAGFICTGLLSG